MRPFYQYGAETYLLLLVIHEARSKKRALGKLHIIFYPQLLFVLEDHEETNLKEPEPIEFERLF